ncbi:hypothetical protein CTI14_70445, partial [Methylobacterium radiotolerans]
VVIPLGTVIGVPRATLILAFPFVLLLMFGVRYVAEALALSLVVIPLGTVIGVPRATLILAFPFVLLLMFGVRYV